MTRILSALTIAMLSAAVIWPTASSAKGTRTATETAADTTSPRASTGIVKAIGASSLTIVGSSGGGAKFTQTFLIDTDTTVVGKGAEGRGKRRSRGV